MVQEQRVQEQMVQEQMVQEQAYVLHTLLCTFSKIIQKGTHKRAFFSTRAPIGVGGLKTRLHMLMQRYRPNGRTLAGNTPKAAVTLDPSGSQEEPSAPSASSSGYTGPALSAEWLLLPKRELKAENMPPLKSKLSLI